MTAETKKLLKEYEQYLTVSPAAAFFRRLQLMEELYDCVLCHEFGQAEEIAEAMNQIENPDPEEEK